MPFRHVVGPPAGEPQLALGGRERLQLLPLEGCEHARAIDQPQAHELVLEGTGVDPDQHLLAVFARVAGRDREQPDLEALVIIPGIEIEGILPQGVGLQVAPLEVEGIEVGIVGAHQHQIGDLALSAVALAGPQLGGHGLDAAHRIAGAEGPQNAQSGAAGGPEEL